MNQTPNYQLSQWEADDRVQRTDFNADNAKIDAAIKAEADARTAGDSALSTQVDSLSSGKADKSALNALTSRVEPLERERFYIGTYTGNGATSRVISLPWAPVLVMLFTYYREFGTAAFLTSNHRAFVNKDDSSAESQYLPELKGSSIVFSNSWANSNGKNAWYILLR